MAFVETCNGCTVYSKNESQDLFAVLLLFRKVWAQPDFRDLVGVALTRRIGRVMRVPTSPLLSALCVVVFFVV
jgi:hypothetical protein